MTLKPGVLLDKLSPQMVLGAILVNSVFAEHGAICTITSGSDGKHMGTSLHYSGNALDFRTKNYVANKQMLLAELKEDLGPNFDVVLEGIDTENEHLHVEYQPKGEVNVAKI